MEPKGYAILGGAANIHANDDEIFITASINDHTDIIELLKLNY
jgi:hypothetical protein